MPTRNPVTTTIDLSGPFFTKDPTKTFRQNVRLMMDRVSAEGQQDVVAQLRAGESSRQPVRVLGPSARVSGYVVGRTRALSGKRWAVSAVVSPSTAGLGRKQAVALMAAASRVEGESHVFRKTTARLRRSRAANMEELLKGLT